jgi:DNA-directed RNA polymerase sigma subunit (sigma70/sigma32)
MREGYNYSGDYTFAQIAAEIGVSKQAIAMIEKKAIAKIAKGLAAKGITRDVARSILCDADSRETAWERLARG